MPTHSCVRIESAQTLHQLLLAAEPGIGLGAYSSDQREVAYTVLYVPESSARPPDKRSGSLRMTLGLSGFFDVEPGAMPTVSVTAWEADWL